MASRSPSLHGFLRRSRRRALATVVLEQSLFAAGAAMAGAIVLLLLGVQFLAWYWIAILFAGSASLGLYRALRRFPSSYAFAQQLDWRLNLHDILSTAYYFTNPRANSQSALFQAPLLRQADVLCAKLSPVAAVPLRMPRSTYSTGLLALTALALFGVRFAVLGTLDLHPPLLPFFAEFTARLQVAALRAPRKAQPPSVPAMSVEIAPDDMTAEAGKFSGQGAPRDTAARDTAAGVATSGLFERMLDKVEDVLTRLTTQDIAGGAATKEDRQAALRDSSASPGGQSTGPAQQASDRSNQQAGEAQSPDRESRDAGSNSGGNDAGDNEGDKNVREAAQLNAAGKITEQYLQRQARITGEIMVEVPGSAEQTLATPYSQVDANHAEGGGRIHRNEVPLIYQDYVERYYQQLRKPSAAPKK